MNKSQASVAVIEKLHETGNYDERSSARYGVDCHFTEAYPWPKTEAGALQLGTMPWEHRTNSKHYLFGSIASFIIGASIF